MTGREKGVAMTACTSCGSDTPMEEQPDGSYAARACSKCAKPATKKEVAADAKELQREHGTDLTDQNGDGSDG